jgi:chromosome transmission fidelity protein 18
VDNEIKHNFVKKTNPMLWSDKYTSYKFFDLLTDEMTNRNVLMWLKSWDEVVFPEKGKVNLKIPESMQR